MKYFYFLLIALILSACTEADYPTVNNIDYEKYKKDIDTIHHVYMIASGTMMYSGGEMHSFYIFHIIDENKDSAIFERFDNYDIPEIGKYESKSIKNYIAERDTLGFRLSEDFEIVVYDMNGDEPNDEEYGNFRNILSVKRYDSLDSNR